MYQKPRTSVISSSRGQGTARKIAVLFYNAVRHGMEYVDPGALSYETRYRTPVVNNLHRRAKAFGFVLQPMSHVSPFLRNCSPTSARRQHWVCGNGAVRCFSGPEPSGAKHTWRCRSGSHIVVQTVRSRGTKYDKLGAVAIAALVGTIHVSSFFPEPDAPGLPEAPTLERMEPWTSSKGRSFHLKCAGGPCGW